VKKLNRLQQDAQKQERRINNQRGGVVHTVRRLANGHLAENPVRKNADSKAKKDLPKT
jgi:hypothetical protein